MEQLSLFSESTVEENGMTNLGAGLSLEIIEGHEKRVKLYSHGVLIKTVNLSDKVAKKLFVIEVRDGDEITSPFVHIIFRPSLSDLQTQNPQNSSTIPAVLRFQIEQI